MGNILNLFEELYHLFINIFFHNNEFFKKNQLSSCIWFHQTWFPHIPLINIITIYIYIYISASEPKKRFFLIFFQIKRSNKIEWGGKRSCKFLRNEFDRMDFFLKKYIFLIFMCKYIIIILINFLFIFSNNFN